jgi:protein disulfide-isomerase
MRLLSLSLLFALSATAIADPADVQPTVFNGVEVPPMPQIEGENFNGTIKDGWWFVKHHS